MGLFDKLRNKPKELTIEDKADYVYDIYIGIDQKCNCKENLDLLNHYERTLYVAMILEIDVHVGGFEEYFYTHSSDFYKEVVSAFEELGSYEAAEICNRAIKALGDNIPVNRQEREDYYNDVIEDSIDETLYNCEVELKEISDDLTSLYYDYIKTNEAYFLNQCNY